MQSILEILRQEILRQKLNIYTVAEFGEDGCQTVPIQPANAGNNSYSIAKAFTMTAVGMLQDDGFLDVHDHVFPLFEGEFSEKYDKRWKNVTIEHLLRHRVGFDCGFLDIDTENICEYGTDDFLPIVLSRRLPFEPGTHYAYSDAAYYLLSRIVTVKTGKKLDDFLWERLFRPLEFQEAAFSRCPKGYPMGATGLYIRTQDMVKLGWVYVNHGVYRSIPIVSGKWVDQVLACGYEFSRQGSGNVYAKAGMNGQMLCFSYDSRKAVAWHGYCPEGTALLDGYLKDSF